MQRAARVAGGMVGMGLGILLSGCGDESAPAIVDETTISWQLQNDGMIFKPHGSSGQGKVSVSCAISGGLIDFTLSAPQVTADERPASVLRVRRANPAKNECIVEVVESPDIDDTKFELEDNCKGTNDGGCTLTGAFGVDGWDFAGTLTCNKLTQLGDGPTFSLFDRVGLDAPAPVIVKLDNCD